LQAHPAAELFPLLAGAEFESFKADIATNGLLEPIWLCDGKILDGRNRFRACTEIGIAPTFRNYEGESPVSFAWSLNGARRHLTTSERGLLARKMLPALHEEAAKRQVAGTLAPDGAKVGKATELAAKIVGVGTSTVERAVRVANEDPELLKRVEAGEITLNAADEALKVERQKRTYRPRAEREQEISALAKDGHRADQIAEKLNIGVEQVRAIARAGAIVLPDFAIGKVHKINAYRVVSTTVQGLEANKIVFDTIRNGEWDITAEDAKEWHASLGKSIKELNWLRNKLGVIASGN
jgi:hypothetical protein